MTHYAPSNPIAGDSLGSADAWYAWAERKGAHRLSELRRYLNTIYRYAPLVGLAAHKLVAQSVHETTEAGVPWASEAWAVTLNPAGIGVTSDAMRTWHDFERGDYAAFAHLVRVSQYVLGSVPAVLVPHQHHDPRGPVPAGIRGNRTTLASFGHPDWRTYPTWATDAKYGEKWARVLNDTEHVFSNVAPPAGDGTGGPQEGPVMGYRAHNFPGFPRNPVYLPDDIPVEIKIIPSSVAGWTSGTRFTGQAKTTWHDTGNPSSNANGEWSWAAGGGRADINSPGSYNGIFDPTKIIICQRFDEIVGHSGTATGNRSWAFEQAFGNGFEGGLRIGAALHGGIIAAMGWSVDTALVQHNYWSGKHCPAQIRNRGLWPQVQMMVTEAARKARAAATGGAPEATVSVGDLVATTTALNIRDAATTSGAIRTTAAAGLEFEVIGGPQESDGYVWWQLRGGGVEGWAAEGSAGVPYLVVTKDAAPPSPVEPTYAKPLAIPELAPFVGRPRVPMPYRLDLSDGGVAFPVFDRVRALRVTPRRQTATGEGRVGPDIEAGLEFDVSFLVLKVGQPDTYVTPWHTVVTAGDVEIVSDVPKDIEPAAPEAA